MVRRNFIRESKSFNWMIAVNNYHDSGRYTVDMDRSVFVCAEHEIFFIKRGHKLSAQFVIVYCKYC